MDDIKGKIKSQDRISSKQFDFLLCLFALITCKMMLKIPSKCDHSTKGQMQIPPEARSNFLVTGWSLGPFDLSCCEPCNGMNNTSRKFDKNGPKARTTKKNPSSY